MAPWICIYPEIVGVCLSDQSVVAAAEHGLFRPYAMHAINTHIHFLGNELFIFLLSCTLFLPQKWSDHVCEILLWKLGFPHLWFIAENIYIGIPSRQAVSYMEAI